MKYLIYTLLCIAVCAEGMETRAMNDPPKSNVDDHACALKQENAFRLIPAMTTDKTEQKRIFIENFPECQDENTVLNDENMNDVPEPPFPPINTFAQATTGTMCALKRDASYAGFTQCSNDTHAYETFFNKTFSECTSASRSSPI